MTSTVKNALTLLGLFSTKTPELGLSELKRLAGMDKATTHRMLTALREAGMLEQHAISKLYRLGPEILRLARVREETFPFTTVVQPVLEDLAKVTGETSHCSLYTNDALAVIASVESNKASRVSVRSSDVLPLHATAAGVAFLAFAPDKVVDDALRAKFTAFTAHTCKSDNAFKKLIAEARKSGFSVLDKAYEDDVCGVAAPIFASGRNAIGALAVATPSHRMTDALMATIVRAVAKSARELSRKLGGDFSIQTQH